MGHIAEKYFEEVEECPKCKGKKFRVVITSHTIFHADKEKGTYWEDEEVYDYGNEDYEVFCDSCGEKINIDY